MAHLVMFLVFMWCYLAYYFVPFILILLIGEWVSGSMARFRSLIFVEYWGPFVVLGLLALSAYRARLASDLNTAESLGFLESHRLSGKMIRFQLSLLPVIGKWFAEK